MYTPDIPKFFHCQHTEDKPLPSPRRTKFLAALATAQNALVSGDPIELTCYQTCFAAYGSSGGFAADASSSKTATR